MNPRPRIAIVGAGGHGRVLLDAVLAADEYEVVGFVDDDPAMAGQCVCGVPVLGSTAEIALLAGQHGFCGAALAIGDNFLRQQRYLLVQAAGLTPMKVIHPRACVSRFAKLGEGVVVLAGAIVGPGAALEENVCINTGASVDHDNHLCSHAHIFPGAFLAGGVTVGAFACIGTGASIIPSISIGACAYVGAGATVIRDVPEGVKVAGVPARQIGVQERRPSAACSTGCFTHS